MTLPEPPEPRRQILDDDTEAARRSDASGSGDASVHRDALKQQDTDMPQDTWVTSFVARLAVLVRDFGGGRK